ncbi:MAG: sigma-70 family RNA polymerase sigma factor [Candidatus Aminicenantes bacterium]|nr:sigma-70 family RNA polymerase sigma factor [Candidatus Aminicenantes bacterium]
MEERELVSRACAGEAEAFSELVSRYQNRVFHLAFGFTRDRAAADDLAQEVFLKAYLALPGFRGKAEFSTWLYRLAINHIKDYLRKMKRRIQREERLEETKISQMPDEREMTQEEEEIMDKRRQLLAKVMATLPEKYRIVLTLRDVEGLPYEEIASILGTSIGTVDSRLHRARKLLREKMEPFLRQEGRVL